MEKHQTAEQFRARLGLLQAQSGLTQSGFAQAIGIDRSALSQLASGLNPRLPRAETLLALAQRFQVSTDWLLGLTEDSGILTQALNAVETEQALDDRNRTAMERWHHEASGQKVRYVPAQLPDLMRTPAVIEFQAQSSAQERRRLQAQTERRLHFSRMPDSDIELCMPVQTLEGFAMGLGAWSGLSIRDRREQLEHIAATLDELYPAFRMYLFDARKHFAPPMTVFGYQQAAIYAGEIYLLVRTRQLVHDLAQTFDAKIRHAEIHAHQAASWVRALPLHPR